MEGHLAAHLRALFPKLPAAVAQDQAAYLVSIFDGLYALAVLLLLLHTLFFLLYWFVLRRRLFLSFEARRQVATEVMWGLDRGRLDGQREKITRGRGHTLMQTVFPLLLLCCAKQQERTRGAPAPGGNPPSVKNGRPARGVVQYDLS